MSQVMDATLADAQLKNRLAGNKILLKELKIKISKP